MDESTPARSETPSPQAALERKGSESSVATGGAQDQAMAVMRESIRSLDELALEDVEPATTFGWP